MTQFFAMLFNVLLFFILLDIIVLAILRSRFLVLALSIFPTIYLVAYLTVSDYFNIFPYFSVK